MVALVEQEVLGPHDLKEVGEVALVGAEEQALLLVVLKDLKKKFLMQSLIVVVAKHMDSLLPNNVTLSPELLQMVRNSCQLIIVAVISLML